MAKSKGYVYLFAAGEPCEGYYKIGKAINPTKRMKQVGRLPFDLQLAHVISCENAFRVESALHKYFSDYHVNGEWFLLPEEHVTSIISCKNESELFDTFGISVGDELPKATSDQSEFRLRVVLLDYLNELAISELAKPQSERKHVPSLPQLAEAIGARYPEENLHYTTVNNLVRGKTKLICLRTAQLILDELWYMGFKVSVSAFLKYTPLPT